MEADTINRLMKQLLDIAKENYLGAEHAQNPIEEQTSTLQVLKNTNQQLTNCQ